MIAAHSLGCIATTHLPPEVVERIQGALLVAALASSPASGAAAMAAFALASSPGLLLAPPDATFTETRSAILAAARAVSPADAATLAAAYARRGLGSCAESPPRTSRDFIGAVEDATVRGNAAPESVTVAIDVKNCDNDGALDVGETATVRTTVGNNGAAGLTDVTVALTSTTPGVEVKTLLFDRASGLATPEGLLYGARINDLLR